MQQRGPSGADPSANSVCGPSTPDDRTLLTRRSAVGIGAGAAAALAIGSLPAWARTTALSQLRWHRGRPDQLPFPDRPMGEPGIPQIEHVVLLMLENHSADNVLGMLPHLSSPRRRNFDGLPANWRGIPIASNPDSNGNRVRSFALPDVCPGHGLTQNWNSSHNQWHGGRNDGFVTNANSTTPMGYLNPNQVPVTYALARHFPVSDRFFCSVLGQTLPNRRYFFSGTSSGQINDDTSSIFVSAANGTIFDRLDAGKVSWRVYYDGTPSPFYFPNLRNNPGQVARCVKNAEFFADASAGRLPSVSYVEPNFSYESEENPQDIAYGESFLRQVAAAVMEGPQWPRTALFITYDEHGGWYDHVPPPRAVPPDNIPPDLMLSARGTFPARFDRYGFRVPLTVVSPWGRPHYVSHELADLTSTLAFIERKWNLPPMTRRDAAAWDLSDMFDITRRRLPEPLELPPAPDIGMTLAKCRADGADPPVGPTGTARDRSRPLARATLSG